MTDTFTVILEEDGDDLVLPLPQELLDELGWNTGDMLEWADEGQGGWSIRKKL